MPQTDYTFPTKTARAGMLVSSRDALEALDTFRYEAAYDTYTLTVGGTATAGDYSFKVNGILVSFTRTSESNDGISDGLVTAGEAEADLNNVAAFTDNGTDTLQVKALHAGEKLEITDVTAPSPGTLSSSNTTDSDKAKLPVGIVVASDDGTTCRQPTTGDTAADFMGVAVIGESALAGIEIEDSGDDDGFAPGTMVPVGEHVDVWVPVEDAVSFGASPYVRIVATGDEVAGHCRSDADGTDAVQWTDATFRSATSGAGLAKLRIRG